MFDKIIASEVYWHRADACKYFAIFEDKRYDLTLNDFPDEPLYTLSFENSCIDIENGPRGWTFENTR